MNDGTYSAVVIEGLLGVASTGNEQVAVSFETTDGDGNPTGERIGWYGTFTDKAAPWTIKALRTMGWKGDDLSDLESIKGTPVSIVVKAEEHKGKMYPKVQFVNPPGGGALLKDQMTPEAAKSFAERMKSKVRLADAANGAPRNNGAPKPRTATLSPEPPYDNTDDIPF